MRQKQHFLFIMLLLFSSVFAQQKLTITGSVSDENREPLIGANIMLATFSLGTTTDFDGNYSLDIPAQFLNNAEDVLEVSFIGYKKRSETFVLRSGKLELNFVLEEDVFRSEEVVVTGIASKTSKSVAEVAVARIDVSELTAKQSYQGLSDLVTGKISGVKLEPSTGNLGGGWRFVVRGGGGLNGDGQPIIYIDGIRMHNEEIEGAWVGGQGRSTLSGLNPQDIEKIEVLKGPAGAAMYGTSGSNGVVLITTKSGKLTQGVGSPISVNYRFNYGLSTPSFKYNKDIYFQAERTDNLFVDAPTREHSISLSGGSPILRYYASYLNRDEAGIMPTNWMKKDNVRLNLSAFPSENLTIRLTGAYSNSKVSTPHGDNSLNAPISDVILYYEPFIDVDSVAVFSLKNLENANQFTGSAQLTWQPINKLEITGGVGLDTRDSRQDNLYPFGYYYSGVPGTGAREIFQYNNNQVTYDLNARYSYTLLDELNVTSIVGSQLFDKITKNQYIDVRGYSNALMIEIGQAEETRFKSEFLEQTKSAGIFTEHNFSYENQYFLSLALRRDYASSIGQNAPAANYPKASFAVRVDKYKDLLPSYMNLLKIRAAYGETGQLPQPRDNIRLLYTAEVGGNGVGAVPDRIGNTAIEPERLKEFEVGLDAELFGKVSLELTYYQQNATKSIVNRQNAPSTGLTASDVPFNVGSIENWGFESNLQAKLFSTSDYSLDLGLIWNYQKNEVTSLGGAQPIISGANAIVEGLPKYEFYTKRTRPVYEIYRDGRYQYSHEFTDGVYSYSEEYGEKIARGNPIPDHTGSLSLNFRFLKNFNLYALADWGLNMKIFNQQEGWAPWTGGHLDYGLHGAQLGWWTNDDYSYIPEDLVPFEVGTPEYIAAAEEMANLEPYLAGNWIRDADYFAVRELSLSYDFTDILSEFEFNNHIKNFTAGFSVRNLLRLSKLEGDEFEGNEFGSRTIQRGVVAPTTPHPRVFSFWVNLGF